MQTWTRLNVAERRQLSPVVAVSTVAFAMHPPQGAAIGAAAPHAAEMALWIPLVRRVRPPFKSQWALPGGPTEWDKTLTETAHETLVAVTQKEPDYLEQLYAFGSIERSAQAERTVTIAYWAQYRDVGAVQEPVMAPVNPSGLPAAEDGFAVRPHYVRDENIAWFPTTALPSLAFDHADIIAQGIRRLRKRTESTLVAHRFLPAEFTLAELRRVTEIIVDKPLDAPNFRRQVLASGEVEETGRMTEGGKHRPAKLYRYAYANCGDD
ncbi:MAG: NUDIX hydrolase [Corynebacterium sp.]|nr:NUDIX hydrolase [Corynebacterium sp.]